MNSKLSAASLAVLALPVAMFAQSYTASLRGVVTDASEAAVPTAQVTVTSVERGVSTVATTDAHGRYVVTALPPGNYTLTVAASGFKRHEQSQFSLQVQQQATVNIKLEVGDLTTSVRVEAGAPLVNTTSANLGQVVDNKYILQLPLLGRNPMALTYLAPGVVGSAGRAGESNTNFVANGSRNSTSDVMIDGVSVTNVEQNSGVTQLKYTPSVDAVQEFKIQTNFFSAEFGNTGGAVINLVTKSGGNDFHGTAYEFHRNSALNANNFFSNRAGRDIPDFTRNVFGGVVGGRIVRNKLFFFGTFERTQQESATSGTLTVPTLQQREGDFSDYRTASGQLIQIFNPFDTFTNAAGDIKRRPFATNRIPRSTIDPIAAAAAAYFPKPNQPGTANTLQNNWFEQGVNSSRGNQGDLKLDWVMSDANRVTSRYSHLRSKSDPANLFGNAANTFNTGRSVTRTHNAVVDFTRMQSPTTILTFRYGYLGQYGDNLPFETFDPTALGLPAIIKNNADFLVFPEFAPEGYDDVGTQGFLVIGRKESVQQFMGSVTKIAGGHSLKLGGELRHFRLDYLQPGFPSGQFSFNRQVTREDRFAGSGTQGNGFASMLLGWGSGSNFHHDPWSYSRSRYWGFFAQDDWKITRKLTLNLGLRYDFDIPRWERDNGYSYWNLDDPSPLNGKVPGFNLRGFYEFADDKTRSPFNGDYNNWQPRVGFAYALTPRTVIRSGYGLYYSLSRATIKGHLGSGFMSTSTVDWSRDSNATRYATLSAPFPNGLTLPLGNSLGPLTFVGLGAGTIVRDNQNPSYQSWNLSLQRELGWQSVIEVNYTGSKGTHLPLSDTSMNRLDAQYWSLGRTALNQEIANPFFGVITDPRSVLSLPTVQRHRLLREFPQYTGVGRSDSEPTRGNSSYHAAQFKFEKRFSHGMALLTHYTISKMIDDASHSASNVNWLGGGTNIQDFRNLRNERSVSAHDIPQRLVLSFNYQLPIGRGKAVGADWGRVTNALAGGWEISGITTFQSGVPLIITQSGGTLWDAAQRPHWIGDPSVPGSVQDRLDSYINPRAFLRPAADALGTAPRTLPYYRAPGLRNFDLALLKNFWITESMRGEFRFETFNTTNTPAFAPPGTSFESAGFGIISGSMNGTGPRNVQLGFKFYF